MIKIQNRIILGLISGIIGELVIFLSNRLFVQLGLVQSSLNSMSLQVLKWSKWIPPTSKRDIWLSRGFSTLFCLSGGQIITYLLSFSKRLNLLKGFLLGMTGGLVPFIFKQYDQLKDFKKTGSKLMCLLSHGSFGLTVALIGKILGDNNRLEYSRSLSSTKILNINSKVKN